MKEPIRFEHLPSEVLLKILYFVPRLESFIAYDNGSGESLLDFWTLRGVSRRWRDCIKAVFKDVYVKNMLVRYSFVPQAQNDNQKPWPDTINVTFEFSHWEHGDEVCFNVKDAWKFKNSMGCSFSQHEYLMFSALHEKWQLCSERPTFYLESDGLIVGAPKIYEVTLDGRRHVRGAANSYDMRMDVQAEKCFFDWKSVFAQHFKNRTSMNRWKAGRNYYFLERFADMRRAQRAPDLNHKCTDIKLHYITSSECHRGSPIGQDKPWGYFSQDVVYGKQYECWKPTGKVYCTEGMFRIQFEHAARRFAARLELSRKYMEQPLVVDALAWVEAVGEGPQITKTISFEQRLQCRRLALALYRLQMHVVTAAGHDLKGFEYIARLERAIETALAPEEPCKDRRLWWNTVGFVTLSELRDFKWPQYSRTGRERIEGEFARLYRHWWESIGVLARTKDSPEHLCLRCIQRHPRRGWDGPKLEMWMSDGSHSNHEGYTYKRERLKLWRFR